MESQSGAAGAGGARSMPAVPDPADASTDAATGVLDAATSELDATTVDRDAGTWWAGAGWKPVEWAPGECTISALEEPQAIEPLQWEPLTLGSLVGETPVVPAGHTYSELEDGTNWAGGPLGAGEFVVAVRDGNGVPVMGFKYATCQFQIVHTGRGVCVLFVYRAGDPGALVCGDLLEPAPLVEFEEGGFVGAYSDELVVVKQGYGHNQHFVDVSDGSVTSSSVPGYSLSESAAYGRNVFVVYMSSEPVPWRGVLFAWDGDVGYDELWDPLPLGVVNVHTDGEQLVWTESEVTTPRTGASIYRAPLPVSPGSLSPTLVRKFEVPARDNWSTLGAGYLAIQLSNRVELIRIADGSRWKVETTEPWQITGARPFIDERSLGFQMFDKNDNEQRWVTFRAKLADVLALPSD